MADTVKLHYSEIGRGPPVILLHGFPLNGTLWNAQRDYLSERYRVIIPDLRGHGQSPAPPGVYAMETLAGDVLALLDSLQVDRAVLFGHSMGGYVALAAWRMEQRRFLALGLVDSQSGADSDESHRNRLQLAEKVSAEGSAAVASAMLPKLFAPGYDRSQPAWSQVQAMILETSSNGLTGALKGMAERPDATAILPAIHVPTLLLTGDKDQLIPKDRARAMADLIPEATLSIIEGAGHLPMLERPMATATAFEAFLNGVCR